MATSVAPTFRSGEATVASAGTAAQLSTTTLRAKSVTIIAKEGNTGKVYVGGSDVASATNDGLAAGAELVIPAVNWLDLKDVYIYVDTNGEGVDWYAQRA